MRTRRALVIGPLMPEFDREGGSRAIFHLIEFLLEDGWAVSYLSLNATGGERYGRALRQLGVAIYAGQPSAWVGDEYLPDVAGLFKFGQFDLAIPCYWHTGKTFLRPLRAFSPKTKVVLASVDLHFLRNARNAFHTRTDGEAGSRLDNNYASEMIDELNVYADCDGVITVSQKEADLLGDFLSDYTKTYVVPLMEDLPLSPIPFPERKGILFLGNFRHPPNIEAVEFLCKKILPLVSPDRLAEHPLYIVGNALNETIGELAAGLENVKLVGWVPDLLPYLHRLRIAVVPLLYGAGTKTKLIQALSAGLPAVSTTLGAEGLHLTSGQNILIGDSPLQFASQIEQLLTDGHAWEAQLREGRHHILQRHGREVVRKSFLDNLGKIMSKEALV